MRPKQKETGKVRPRRIDHAPTCEDRGKSRFNAIAEKEMLLGPSPQYVGAVSEGPDVEALAEVGDAQHREECDQQKLQWLRDSQRGTVAGIHRVISIALKHQQTERAKVLLWEKTASRYHRDRKS